MVHEWKNYFLTNQAGKIEANAIRLKLNQLIISTLMQVYLQFGKLMLYQLSYHRIGLNYKSLEKCNSGIRKKLLGNQPLVFLASAPNRIPLIMKSWNATGKIKAAILELLLQT